MSNFSFLQSCKNVCDDDFYQLMQNIESKTVLELLNDAIKSAQDWIETDCEYYESLFEMYKNWYGINDFAMEPNFIQCFGGLYDFLKSNVHNLYKLYDIFTDYRSKYTMKTIVQHWLTFSPDIRKYGIESTFPQYFDLDIIRCDENEVFVDCGGYVGDTVEAYLSFYGNRYKSIYSYEITTSNFEIAKHKLKDVKRLFLRNVGVSDANAIHKLLEVGTHGIGNRLHEDGNIECSTVRIDDDISEDITFIKMDIEGGEINALEGARNQIQKNRPKLAIALYHNRSDLIEIPQYINKITSGYKFYLRNYSLENFPFPTEYVLFAMPC